MRAVNLIPAEERRGGGSTGGRSGGAVYVVLGALAVAVVLLAMSVLAGRQVDDRRAELAEVTQQADAARAQVASLANYTAFAQVRASREATVRSLIATRFDWSHALREVARVIPADTVLSCLRGSVTAAASAGGGCSTGDSNGLRGQRAVPALELSGCTRSNKAVARLISRLRQIDGVSRVSLASAAKAEGAATAGATGGGACKGGDQAPSFSLVVFFEPESGPGVPAGSEPTTAGTTGPTGPAGATSNPQPAGGTP